MTIYMYLTQEFKNRAENLIGIQNSHGQHPCPFWKFLHREYRPFGNIFWYLDRDLDWDLQRSRGAAGPEEEEEYALVWRARLRALSICFCAFPCALFADVPAASPTAFSRDIVKWREEKLVSVCFRFIFFCFAAGFLVNRRYGKSPSFVHNHSCCFCFSFPLWNRAWRMSCGCRPVSTGGALFPGSSFYFFRFWVCCDCDIRHLRLLEHEHGCRVLMPALCGHFIELFAALTRLSTRLFCVLFLQSFSPRQRYFLFLSISFLPGRSDVFVWLLRYCVSSSQPGFASFSELQDYKDCCFVLVSKL